MDVTKRIGTGLVTVGVLASAAAISATEPVAAGTPANQPFLPDLRTIAPGPDSLHLKHNEKTGKMTLRLANKVANVGTGPLDLAAADPTGDCDPGDHDDPDRPDRDANQRLYEDTDGDTVYDPSTSQSDTDVDEISEETRVGCFEYHPAHVHWHLQDFSQYSLTEVDTGELVDRTSPSRKIGFCILDGWPPRFPELPGSPNSPVYPSDVGAAEGCGQGDPAGGPGAIGLSVGYADLYSWSTPGQSLDLTGVAPGVYCLVSRANPPDGPTEIIESDTTNNTRGRQIRIRPLQDEVDWLHQDCPAP